MWKRYEKTMIENSNIQNFIFVSLQLDRHIITEFDKMKIDIYAIRIFTFYLLKISFSLNHQHFLNFRLDLICWVRSKADSKKVWIMNGVRKKTGRLKIRWRREFIEKHLRISDFIPPTFAFYHRPFWIEWWIKI